MRCYRLFLNPNRIECVKRTVVSVRLATVHFVHMQLLFDAIILWCTAKLFFVGSEKRRIILISAVRGCKCGRDTALQHFPGRVKPFELDIVPNGCPHRFVENSIDLRGTKEEFFFQLRNIL